MRLIRLAVALFCSACCALSAFAQNALKPASKTDLSEVLFRAGSATVTTDEFIYLYSKNHQDKPAEFRKDKIEEYLKLFIDFKLKVQEAKRRGMDTTAAFLKEYNTYRAEVRKPYLPDNALIDSLTRLTYARMQYEVRAAHILIAMKADPTPVDTLAAYNQAVELRKKILAGLDFGAAATQYSGDPSAKINKGDLGYFTALQMVYPFENAAYSLNAGEISAPVRTRFGYHLIRVADKRPARGEVDVSHIMVRVRDQEDEKRAKDVAFSVYEQLQAGVPWNDLCRQFSEDPSTKDQGGKLKPFGIGGMAGVPEFEAAAFDLVRPGDYSDPVRTQYGWHIIRLDRKIPLGSYDAMVSALRPRVARDERTALSRTALLRQYRSRYSLHENEEVKQKVFALADSTLTAGKWHPPMTGQTGSLFTLKGKAKSAHDFLVYAVHAQRAQQRVSPAHYIEQLYSNFLEASILDAVEEDIAGRYPTFTYLLREYYEGILLFEIMEKEVWGKASTDSTGQRSYYRANAAKYKAQERAKATLYSSSSDAGFAELRELIKDGDERKIQEYATARKIRIESGTFQRNEKDVLSKVSWVPGVYTVENSGMYYLAWLKEVLAPGRMSFEEARPAVITDFQAATEKKWLEQLRKKYPVKVNEKGKKYVIATLESERPMPK